MSKLIFTIVVFSFAVLELSAQTQILGLGTRWSDSFREWEIQTNHDDVEGYLKLRWAFQDNWSEWDLRVGDTTATIRQKWENDPDLWEISALGVTVTARTTWRGDFKSWRLSDGKHQLTWKSRYANMLGEWELRDQQYGNYLVHTYYERDPRDWVVIDEMDPDISYAMRLAMIFLAIYHATPKV